VVLVGIRAWLMGTWSGTKVVVASWPPTIVLITFLTLPNVNYRLLLTERTLAGGSWVRLRKLDDGLLFIELRS